MEKGLSTNEIQDAFFESLKRIAIGFIVGSFIFAASFLVWDKAAYAQGADATEEDQPKTLFGDALADAGITVSGATAVNSQYIWRGFRLDDDMVLQPSMTISAFGFSANVWGNFDLQGDDPFSSDEVDSTISYAYTLEEIEGLSPITLSAGHIYYSFSGTDTYSREYFLGVTYGSFLTPSLTYYHDYGDEDQGGGDGNYVVLGLAQSVPVLPDYGVTLDLSGHIGYNDELYIAGQGGDVLASAGLTVPLTANLKMQPNINYSHPMDDLRDDAFGNQPDVLFSGINFMYNM